MRDKGSGAVQSKSPAVPRLKTQGPLGGRPSLESPGHITSDGMFAAVISVSQNGKTEADVMNGAGS